MKRNDFTTLMLRLSASTGWRYGDAFTKTYLLHNFMRAWIRHNWHRMSPWTLEWWEAEFNRGILGSITYSIYVNATF